MEIPHLRESEKMGQDRVLKILKKHGRPMSPREIAEEMGINPQRVYVILSKLSKYEEVVVIEINRLQARLLYNQNIKRRMCLYYLPNNEKI